MKDYVHARLSREDRDVLEQIKAATGRSESDIVRLGVRLAAEQLGTGPSALALAGKSVGRFDEAPRDLSVNRDHLEGFGR